VDALLALSHTCNPALCRGKRTCCSSYDVRVAPRRVTALVGLLPHAARYAPWLRNGDEFEDPFEEDSEGCALATHEDGTCMFAFRGNDGGTRCSLHAAALDLGLAPHRSKPKSCALWPLALSGSDPLLLTVQDDALSFPCNAARRGTKSLHEGVAEIIATLFGASFLERLNTALKQRAHRKS